MSEVIESQPPVVGERQRIGVSIADLVTVGRNGRTFHRSGIVNTGRNRIRNGQMLSTYELMMIEANADVIRDGLKIRHRLGTVASKEADLSTGNTLDSPAKEGANTDIYKVDNAGRKWRIVIVDGAELMIPAEDPGDPETDDDILGTGQPARVIVQQSEAQPIKPPLQKHHSWTRRWGNRLRGVMVGLLMALSLRRG